MKLRLQPTVWQVFAAALACAGLLLGAQFVVLHHASRSAVVDVTERLCASASAGIARRAGDRLRAAADAVHEFEIETSNGLARPGDAASVEAALTGAALRRQEIAEIAFTFGRLVGRDPDGRATLAADGRGQVAVERRIGPEGGVFARRTERRGAVFVATTVPRDGDRTAASVEVSDPTEHLTFVTPATTRFAGRTLWSDLHSSELDGARPPELRRSVVAAQRAIFDAAGSLLGVVRVAIATEGLDAITVLDAAGDDAPARPLVFLCDRDGRLIAPVGPAHRLEETEAGLRVPPAAVPAAIARALELESLRRAPDVGSSPVDRFSLDGRDHLVAFTALPDSQEWVVGVVVAEDAYTGGLERTRAALLAIASCVALALLAGGWALSRAAGRSVGAIVRETDRMRAFDFAAADARRGPALQVREVASVLDSIEQAKAALRALSKFVPVGLVRRLYADGGEPTPGGELRAASVLFSDIEGFTGLSERMAPDELGAMMACYFDAMTAAVHATHGIVDKFIGDSVMAIWNAPDPIADHAVAACRAALACAAAETALQRAPGWAGRPAIRTRFGIHTAVVFVGNIGARDRLNFTALGDGVNLASRLEGLNRHYGTSILVSDDVARAAAGSGLTFRRIDRVAVKGRAGGLLVHELLSAEGPRADALARYERALDAYFGRDFAAAAALLAASPDDAPSLVLRDRCAAYEWDPPPSGWDGTFTHHEK